MTKITHIFPVMLAAVFLSGCQHTQARVTPQPATLVYWSIEPEAVFEPLITEYHKTHPSVTITYRQQSVDRYRVRLSGRLKNKGQAETPDIISYHVGWLPMLKEVMARAPGSITDDLRRDFPPVVSQGLVIEGQTYGVPLALDGLVLLVNEEMLTAKNLAAPKTWEEFGKGARELTKKDDVGSIQIAGAAIGTMNNIEHASELVGVMLLQAGSELGKDDRLTADVLSYYTGFAQGTNRVWDARQDPSLTAFAGGRVAMVFAPTYRIPEILTANPQLKLKVVPIPQIAEKLATKQAVSWGSFWAEGVAGSSPHQTQAWEFIAWLSQPEQLYRLSGERAKVVQFAPAYPRLSMLSRHVDDRYVAAVAGQAPIMRTLPLYSATKDEGINDQLSRVLLTAVNAIVQGRDAQDVARQLGQDFTQTLQQYDL